MQAIHATGRVLQYASERLRSDRDVVIAAVMNNRSALQYASENLQNDSDVIAIARANKRL